MIEFFKEKVKAWRLRVKLRKEFSPRPEFLAYCRAIFLEKVAQKIPDGQIKLAGGFSFTKFARYSLTSFFVLLFFGSGAVVYADATNVSYNHPLYNFKRVAETVRLKLAPSEQVAALRTEFAERRVQEIKIITTQEPIEKITENIKKDVQIRVDSQIQEHQQKMVNLRNGLKQQVSSVVEEIEAKKAKNASAADLCDSMSRIMKEDEEIDKEEAKKMHEENWSRFKKNCGEVMK